MTTEQRLENLERELARAKRRSRWLLPAVLLGAGVVILAAAWMGTQEKALAGNAAKAPTIIRANEFILQDENGKTRAALSTDKDGPILRLCDEKGKGRVGLAVDKNGPALDLYDENGKVRIGLAMFNDGPLLYLRDDNGKFRATIGACDTTKPDGTRTISPESTILLYNKEGKVSWQTP